MPPSKNTSAQVVILFLLGWVFFFNVMMKQYGFADSFFQLIDTISEDLVMGSGSGIIAALMLGCCAILTMGFVRFLSERDFFVRVDENLCLADGFFDCLSRFLHMEDREQGKEVVPSSVIGIVVSLSFIYAWSALSIFVYSQPFWESISSAQEVRGIVLFALIPMLTLRGMTLLGYKKGSVLANGVLFSVLFLLLLGVGSFVGLLPSVHMCYPTDIYIQKLYVYDMTLYSFLPVLFEGLAWLVLLFSSEDNSQ